MGERDQTMPLLSSEITVENLRDKIYEIRGQKVMMDFDLARIYGYETKNFNRQIKNNIERFEGEDFMFQLTKGEFENLRCKNSTSSWGGSRYLPYAFTEQGIYLLMTVLKGDLAVKQSRTLVRLFKSMKDYLVENRSLLTQNNYFALVDKVEENTREIKEIKDNMVTGADLSDFIKLFNQGLSNEEILILDGNPFKADEAYQKIYRSAKSRIIIIDDYIGTKTLHHLAHAKKNVKITIISDNVARPKLRLGEYDDFVSENPGRGIVFLRSMHRVHDRYIIVDYKTKSEKIFHCGCSSKDAGKKITTITETDNRELYHPMVEGLLKQPELELK